MYALLLNFFIEKINRNYNSKKRKNNLIETFIRIKNKIKKITNVKSNNDDKNHLKRN